MRRRSTISAVAITPAIPSRSIYNWPQATGVDIPVEAVVAISEHPNVIAIKESSGNLEKVMSLLREVKHGFQVLVGSAPTLWPSLLMARLGAILAYANAALHSVIAIWEAFRTEGMIAAVDWIGRTVIPRGRSCHHEGRRAGAQACDGSERILWRSAAAAVVRAYCRGEARNRRGVRELRRDESDRAARRRVDGERQRRRMRT